MGSGNEMERRGGEWDQEMTAVSESNPCPRGRSSLYMVEATACATMLIFSNCPLQQHMVGFNIILSTFYY